MTAGTGGTSTIEVVPGAEEPVADAVVEDPVDVAGVDVPDAGAGADVDGVDPAGTDVDGTAVPAPDIPELVPSVPEAGTDASVDVGTEPAEGFEAVPQPAPTRAISPQSAKSARLIAAGPPSHLRADDTRGGRTYRGHWDL
jgi:hypothetical protein